MSSTGRCQDALFDLFLGYEYNSNGDTEPGLLEDIDRERVYDLIDKVIDAIYPIAHAQGMSQQRHNDLSRQSQRDVSSQPEEASSHQSTEPQSS